jgi:hypothetical protein
MISLGKYTRKSLGVRGKLIWISLFMSNGVNAIYALDAKTSTDINLGGSRKGSELKSSYQMLVGCCLGCLEGFCGEGGGLRFEVVDLIVDLI